MQSVKYGIEYTRHLITIFGGVTLYLFGNITDAMILLSTLIVLDFSTGMLKAAYQKRLNSTIGYNGIIKKVGLLFCIVIAHLIDLYLDSGTLIRDITINMFIVIEILSNLENLCCIDNLFPKFIRDVLKKYIETKRG